MRSFLVCWLIFVVSIYHAWGQDPLPIMELYAPDVNSVTKISECKDGLMNDVDFITVRGKVNKNGSNADAYKDTNLYLQTIADPIDSRASQCQPDLTVCGSNLSKDCYCESNDANGDYHIVMTIIAKSIYSGGKLILSWNDARSPFNTPILSNQVDYYPGTISEPKIVTIKIGSFDKTIDTDPSSDTYTDFRLDYKEDITSATFCVNNLEANSLIEIKENENSPVQTTSASCVTLDFTDQGPNRVLTMSFMESVGCERTGSYILRISPGSDCGLEDYQIALIVIDCLYWVAFVVVLIIICCYKCINISYCGLEAYQIALIVTLCTLCVPAGVLILIMIFYHKRIKKSDQGLKDLAKSHEKVLMIVIVCCLWANGVVFLFILIDVKQTCKPDCGVEDYEIALIVIMCILISLVMMLVLVLYYKCNKSEEIEIIDGIIASDRSHDKPEHTLAIADHGEKIEIREEIISRGKPLPPVRSPRALPSDRAPDRTHNKHEDKHVATHLGENKGFPGSPSSSENPLLPLRGPPAPPSDRTPDRSQDKHKDNHLTPPPDKNQDYPEHSRPGCLPPVKLNSLCFDTNL